MTLRSASITLVLALLTTPVRAQTSAVSADKKNAPDNSPDIHKRVDSLPPADVKQAIDLLRANYLKPEALTDPELDRATLQGILSRIAPGGQIVAPASPTDEGPSPFRAEILDNRIGYLRLGSLSKSSIEGLDTALKNFASKPLKAVILDLRATPPSNEFDLAAEVVKRFSPKGKILFTIRKPSAKQERIFTSDQDAMFHDLLVVLADRETSGASEVLLAALRAHAKAMVVGQPTAGQAAEFADMPLTGGKVLRIAVAEIALPDAVPIFPGGVKPDITVEIPDAQKRELMRQSLETGVSQTVSDIERPRMNEAALVAGKNPELDALQAAQQNKSPSKSALHDPVLQRAVDLITSIGIFESRAKK